MGIQYGVLLQEFAHQQVDFVDTWTENVEKIREQGGAYVSQDGEGRHLVPINVYYPEEYAGDPDVWIVFVKQHQLPEFLERTAPHFREHQVVFSAMNGYGHFEKLAEYFPKHRIYGGTALIGAYVYGPGDFNFTGGAHAKAMNLCAYDEHDVEEDPIERQLFADFQAATLNPTIVRHFLGMCLAKIVFNSVLNTLCTMYQIRFGEVRLAPRGSDSHRTTGRRGIWGRRGRRRAIARHAGKRGGDDNAHGFDCASVALSVDVPGSDEMPADRSGLHQRLHRTPGARTRLCLPAA